MDNNNRGRIKSKNSSDIIIPDIIMTIKTEPEVVAEQLYPDNMETSGCQSCSILKKHFEDKFKETNDTITNLKDIIIKQNDVVMKSLAEQKVLVERLISREVPSKSMRSVFPLKSLAELNELNETISDSNRDVYINIMKTLLEGRLSKTFTEVISMSLCLEINLDGIHGKKRLKDFKAFYEALTDACRLILGSDEVEKELRNALKIIKKRHIHAECIRKKSLKLENFNFIELG